MQIHYIILFVAMIGLFIPAHAQNLPTSETFVSAINEAKSCKKLIQENQSMTEAEKIVGKRLCANAATNKITGDLEIKNKRLYELQVKNLVQCETWYDNYKNTTIETFKILKPRQLADDCITLYNNDVWKYKEKDRSQKILERAEELKLFQIIKVKAEFSENGLPPLKQVKKGIPKSHVDCKNDFVLMYKSISKKPSCVKTNSVDQLIERDWGSLFLNN